MIFVTERGLRLNSGSHFYGYGGTIEATSHVRLQRIPHKVLEMGTRVLGLGLGLESESSRDSDGLGLGLESGLARLGLGLDSDSDLRDSVICAVEN
jgi:hypothetical protein